MRFVREKKLFFTAVVILFMHPVALGQVKISDFPSTSGTVNANAILELESTSRGIIPPRVVLSSASSESPLTAPVENGTLIYNTSGNIPAGYYVWQGMWVMVGSKTLNIVEKTTSGTLGKEETMVLAKPQSGDGYLLTLALPEITAADNGLSITIKNAGVARGLVKVTGYNGNLTIIDENDVQLTRYHSKTFIASNGAWWVQQVQPELHDVLNVGDGTSWTTPAEISDFLSSHYGTNIIRPCVVRFSQGDFIVDASFSVNYTLPLTIEGASAGNTTLSAGSSLGTNPLITAATQTHIRNLKLQSSSAGTGEAIRITGATPIEYTVENVNITGFSIGILQTSNSILTLTGSDISSCNNGVYVNSGVSGAKARVSNCIFTSNNNAVNLNSGTNSEVYISGNHFLPGNGNTAISRNTGTFTTPADVFINENTWNNTGAFLSGIDLTLATGRDAMMQIRDNAGYNHTNGYVYFQVTLNATTTTGTTNQWRKAQLNAGTIASSSKLFEVTNNTFEYLSDYPADCIFTISGELSGNTNNAEYKAAILRNGIPYGQASFRRFGTYVPFSTTGFIPDLQKGDVLEFHVMANNNSTIVVRNLNLLIETR